MAESAGKREGCGSTPVSGVDVGLEVVQEGEEEGERRNTSVYCSMNEEISILISLTVNLELGAPEGDDETVEVFRFFRQLEYGSPVAVVWGAWQTGVVLLSTKQWSVRKFLDQLRAETYLFRYTAFAVLYAPYK
jgi:hypothetical protein